MLITHEWSINEMQQLNDGSGTVVSVSYVVKSTDGNFSIQSSGTVELQTENIENFILYENLTEDIVIGWVKEKLGPNLGNHEINNSSWINSINNSPKPKTISENLPW